MSEAQLIPIVSDRQTWLYAIAETPSEIGGRGWILRRLTGGEYYNIHLSDAGGFSCSCRGWERWKRCKHTVAVGRHLFGPRYGTAMRPVP